MRFMKASCLPHSLLEVVATAAYRVVTINFILQTFFQPAVENIKNNLGASSVSDEHVRDVCRQILEEAKQMYGSNSHSRGSSPSNEHSDSETGSIGEYRFGGPNTRVSTRIITFCHAFLCLWKLGLKCELSGHHIDHITSRVSWHIVWT
jgi:hypothetical protein